MRSIRFHLLSSLTLALLGVCFSSGLASAQGFAGKFTLPFEARWGIATLPAGNYDFKLDARPDSPVRLFQGTHAVAMIYAQSWDQKSSGRNSLTVVRDGAAGAIREINLPEIELVLYYAPHKAHRGSAQEERQVAQIIPIAAAGAGR